MIEFGWFRSHSGISLPWKINLDSWTDDDWRGIAQLILSKMSFSQVYGIPRGGKRLEAFLKPYCVEGHPFLFVDDVLTTGASMEEARKEFKADPAVGIVVFSRIPYMPKWIKSIFSVNELAGR